MTVVIPSGYAMSVQRHIRDSYIYEAFCDRNAQNRSRLTMMHCSGSKSFAQHQYEWRDIETRQLCGQIDVYQKIHRRTIGEWLPGTRERHDWTMEIRS
ncbi:uncharacterized protein [Elaeis guineensis]|uniref:uncharacterized protein isoform X2 n=1 Tax=Elaeis guineensis var. tenera TaxID=51953 RepID=UPI003C6D9EE1